MFNSLNKGRLIMLLHLEALTDLELTDEMILR